MVNTFVRNDDKKEKSSGKKPVLQRKEQLEMNTTVKQREFVCQCYLVLHSHKTNWSYMNIH